MDAVESETSSDEDEDGEETADYRTKGRVRLRVLPVGLPESVGGFDVEKIVEQIEDHEVSQENDDQTEDGVEYRLASLVYTLVITHGNDVAETAKNYK